MRFGGGNGIGIKGGKKRAVSEGEQWVTSKNN